MRGPILHCLAVCALLLAGCATRPVATAEDGTRFILLRHAEKTTDDPRDPELAPAGRARVEKLVSRLHGEPLTAVYSSGYRRTQATATPIAADHRLPVTTYDAARPAQAFGAELRRAHPRGTVLVVGHSNTVPALAAALCACSIDPTADDEYGRRITINVLRDGRVTVDDRREP